MYAVVWVFRLFFKPSAFTKSHVELQFFLFDHRTIHRLVIAFFVFSDGPATSPVYQKQLNPVDQSDPPHGAPYFVTVSITTTDFTTRRGRQKTRKTAQRQTTTKKNEKSRQGAREFRFTDFCPMIAEVSFDRGDFFYVRKLLCVIIRYPYEHWKCMFFF